MSTGAAMELSRSTRTTLVAAILTGLAIALSFSSASTADVLGAWSVGVEDVVVESSEGKSLVQIPGCSEEMIPGRPVIPTKCLYYVIPSGEEVRGVEILSQVWESVPGTHRLVRAPMDRLGTYVPAEQVPIDLDPDQVYPERALEHTFTGYMSGYKLVGVLVKPVRYVESTGQLSFCTGLEFKLRCSPGTDRSLSVEWLSESASRDRADRVKLFVETREGVWPLPPTGTRTGAEDGGFSPSTIPSLEGSSVDYVIITSDDLVDSFQQLADLKIFRGTTAVIRSVSWIDENYPWGTDAAERVRLFIQDAYRLWGTKFVLLGGDSNVVPVRFIRTTYYLEDGENMPCDMYYECLDGNWNADGDQYFGEGLGCEYIGDPGDSVDFLPEISVGRWPVETTEEFDTYYVKYLKYNHYPPGDFIEKALFLGEVLFPVDWHPGEPIYLDGGEICDSTAARFPDYFDTTKVYEVQGEYYRNALLGAIDDYYGIVCIAGHADAFRISAAAGTPPYVLTADVDTMENIGRTPFWYHINCNSSAVDLECINEAFFLADSTGAVAITSASRYDFPYLGRYYQAKFFEMLFQNDITEIGELHSLHKLWRVGYGVDADHSAERWTQLTYLLFGDPQMRLWRRNPQQVRVFYPPFVSIDDTSVTITVETGVSPVDGALVCLSAEGQYARGVTNAEGSVELPLQRPASSTISLSGVKDDYHHFTGGIMVFDSGRQALRCMGYELDDDAFGMSWGDMDGIPEAGENVELLVDIQNTGGVSMDSVSAVMRCLPGSSLTFDIEVDGAADTSRVVIGHHGAHPQQIPFTLTMGDPSAWGRPYYTPGRDSTCYVWQDEFGWHMDCVGDYGAHTFLGSVSTDGGFVDVGSLDTEDGDEISESPGLVTFYLTLNEVDLSDRLEIFPADSSFVVVTDSLESLGTIDVDETATATFAVEIPKQATDRHMSRFVVEIGAAGGYSASDVLEMVVRAPLFVHEMHWIDDVPGHDMRVDPGDTVEVIVLFETPVAVMRTHPRGSSGRWERMQSF